MRLKIPLPTTTALLTIITVLGVFTYSMQGRIAVKEPQSIIDSCETAVTVPGQQAVEQRLDEWRQAFGKHRMALEKTGHLTEFMAVIEQAETALLTGNIAAAYDRLTDYHAHQLWCTVESSALAPRIYVDGNTGDDTRSGLRDWTNAVKTIQVGVDKAGAGGMVLVAPGHYKLTAEIAIEKGITLRSWHNGVLDTENTIIDGQKRSRCLFIDHNRAHVAGFTLTGGNGAGKMSADVGGALAIWTRGGKLSHCIVHYNTANKTGGGVYMAGTGGAIEYCDIQCNSVTNLPGVTRGAGVYLSGGTLRNSTLAFNTNLSLNAYRGGGGVFIRGSSDPHRCQVSTCIISNNEAYGGAGMTLDGGAIVVSNTIVANRSVAGGYSYGGGALLYRTTHGSLFAYNTVSGNHGASLGGGIFIWPAMPAPPARGNLLGGVLVDKCIITDNSVWRAGGGIHVFIPNPAYTNTRVSITASDISRNRVIDNAGKGGGVAFWDAPGQLENCVISGNQAEHGSGGGLYIRQTFMREPQDTPEKLLVRHCRIIGNKAVSEAGVSIEDEAGIGESVFLEDCEISENKLISTNRD